MATLTADQCADLARTRKQRYMATEHGRTWHREYQHAYYHRNRERILEQTRRRRLAKALEAALE